MADAAVVDDRIPETLRPGGALLRRVACDAERVFQVLALAGLRVARVVVRAHVVVVAVLPFVLATPARRAEISGARLVVIAVERCVFARVVDACGRLAGLVRAFVVRLAPALGLVAVGVGTRDDADLGRCALRLVRAGAGLPLAQIVRAGVFVVAVAVRAALDAAEFVTAVWLCGVDGGAEIVVRLVLYVAAELAGIDRAGDAVVHELRNRRAYVERRVADRHDARIAELAVRVLDAAALHLVVGPAARGIADVRSALFAVRLLYEQGFAVAGQDVARALVAGVAAEAVGDGHAGTAEAEVVRACDAVVADHGLVNADLIRITEVHGARVVVAALRVAGALAWVVETASSSGAAVFG